jgi:hypothetical protein
LHTIAFFWVGDDISIPRRLVSSIRLVMGQSVEVIQLSDQNTLEIPGVTEVQRFNLSPFIMVARLQAYAQVKTTTAFTFFCDADSIFVNPLDISFFIGDVFLTPRTNDHPINDQYPEFYPEFTGKMIKEVMPVLFGALAVKGTQKEFFDYLLTACLELPERFHRWYGDQYALASVLNCGQFDFGYLDPVKHLFIVRSEISVTDIAMLKGSGVQMITFKGRESKLYMEGTLKNLRELIINTAIR